MSEFIAFVALYSKFPEAFLLGTSGGLSAESQTTRSNSNEGEK